MWKFSLGEGGGKVSSNTHLTWALMLSLKMKRRSCLPTSISQLSVLQDGFYLSLQRGVDWFAVMVGMPPERKYNSVLFGGMKIRQRSSQNKKIKCCFQVSCGVDVRNDEENGKKYKRHASLLLDLDYITLKTSLTIGCKCIVFITVTAIKSWTAPSLSFGDT